MALVVGGTALGPLASGAAATSLLYYGGPVVHSANVVLVKWGSRVRASYTASSTGDPGFFNYLASQNGSTSDIGGVLAQYMDTTGQNSQNHFTFAGTDQITPSVGATTPANVSDSQIHTALAGAINSHVLPAPSGDGLSTVYVVLFPPGDDVCFGGGGGCAYDATGGFCAYHGSFTLTRSTHVLYTAMVDDGSGTPNFGFCGPSSNDLQNQTSVVGHELAETINDPLVAEASGSGPPLGWYDPAFDGEIADKCDAAPLATNGAWTVEPVWSNLDANCMSGEPAYSAPVASFLTPSVGTTGQPVSLDASASSDPAQNHAAAFEQGVGSALSIDSGITRYAWNWGDGAPGTSATTPTGSHTYASVGTYQVSLTVTDRLGFTSTSTRQVSVTDGGSLPPSAQTGSATNVDSQQATLGGTVNPQNHSVNYRFAYGTSPDTLSLSSPSTAGPAGQGGTAVSATLTGLRPSTTYYYQLVVSTAQSSYPGAVASFTTSSAPAATQTPVVATGPAARITARGSLLTGTINPGGKARVQYRFSYGTALGALSEATGWSSHPGGTTSAPVSATVGGLRPGTTYYVELQASLNGQAYHGGVQSFTTRNALPGVRTGSAHKVISNSAVVAGWVDPHGASTRYQVQFGPSSGYGHSTSFVPAGSASAGKRVTELLFGLRPHHVYHYRLVAESAGGTVVGSDRTFTTARRLAAAPRFSFRAPARISRRRLRARRLRLRFGCSKACTAHFVLTVAPAGISQTAAVPLTIAHASRRLGRSGSGAVWLRFSGAVRHQRAEAGHRRLKLLLLGYAVSDHSSASPPQEHRISLF